MPDRHLYLSDYPDHYITAHCPLCGRSVNYDTVDIASKIGNCQIAGLKTTIGREWNCSRLYNLNYDQCRLEIRIGGSLKPKEVCGIPESELLLIKMGAYRISSDTRLSSLASWQHLHVACCCGHIGRLEHAKLRVQFGDRPLKELTGKMNCKLGKGHAVHFFAIYQEKR